MKMHELRGGSCVRLVEGPAEGPIRHYYKELYVKPGQIAIVGALTADTVTLDALSTRGGEIARLYADNKNAIFEVLQDPPNDLMEKWVKSLKGSLLKSAGGSTGSDPEVFAVDENGVVIPAWRYLKDARPSATAVPFWDGFQAEFTVSAGPCHAYVVDSFFVGLDNTLAAARAFNPKARLTSASVLDVPEDMMREADDKHAALGCAPSVNAYPDAQALSVSDPRTLPFRFAGGHLHFGIGVKDTATMIQAVKGLDAIFGVASVAMFRGLEDPRRRKFYGTAGEYRTPAHGLEYRVPSSLILCHPVVTHLCLDLSRAALSAALRGIVPHIWTVQGGEVRVRDIINNYDVDGALAVLKDNNKALDALLSTVYVGTAFDYAKDMILSGVKESLNPDDMERSWHLGVPEVPLPWGGAKAVPRDQRGWIRHAESPNCSMNNFVKGE